MTRLRYCGQILGKVPPISHYIIGISVLPTILEEAYNTNVWRPTIRTTAPCAIVRRLATSVPSWWVQQGARGRTSWSGRTQRTFPDERRPSSDQTWSPFRQDRVPWKAPEKSTTMVIIWLAGHSRPFGLTVLWLWTGLAERKDFTLISNINVTYHCTYCSIIFDHVCQCSLKLPDVQALWVCWQNPL